MNISSIKQNLYSKLISSTFQNKKELENIDMQKNIPKIEPKTQTKEKDVKDIKNNHASEKEIKDSFEKLSSQSAFEKEKILNKDEDKNITEKQKEFIEEKKDFAKEKKEKEFRDNLKEINEEYIDENTKDIEKMIKRTQKIQELKTQISMQKRIRNIAEELAESSEKTNGKDARILNKERIEEYKNENEKRTRYLKNVINSMQDTNAKKFYPQKDKPKDFNITI